MALNSRETIESVKFAAGLWLDVCDEGGLAWGDTKNNRDFLSGGDRRPAAVPIGIEAKRLSRRHMGLTEEIARADVGVSTARLRL